MLIRKLAKVAVVASAGAFWLICLVIFTSTISTRFACSVETGICNNQISSYLRENVTKPVNIVFAKAWIWSDPHGAQAVADQLAANRLHETEATCREKFGDSSGYIHCMVGVDNASESTAVVENSGEEPTPGLTRPPLSQQEKIFLGRAMLALSQMKLDFEQNQLDLKRLELARLRENLTELEADQAVLDGGITSPPIQKESLIDSFRKEAR